MTGVLLGRKGGSEEEERREEKERLALVLVCLQEGQCAPDNHKGQVKATDLLK